MQVNTMRIFHTLIFFAEQQESPEAVMVRPRYAEDMVFPCRALFADRHHVMSTSGCCHQAQAARQ